MSLWKRVGSQTESKVNLTASVKINFVIEQRLILTEVRLDKFSIFRGPVKFLTTMTKMKLSLSVNTEKH